MSMTEKMMNHRSDYLFFMDVETTGFDPIRNDLITCCVIVTNQDLEPVGSFYEKVKPDFNEYYSESAEKIHGFTKKEMETWQSRRSFLIKLLHFLNQFRTAYQRETMIFHALRNFDFNFLQWAFKKEDLIYSLYKMFIPNETVSTIHMAREAGYTDNKLDTWAKRLKFDLQHHNAKSDTQCCIEVFGFLQNEIFENGKTTNTTNDHNDAEKFHNHVGARIES